MYSKVTGGLFRPPTLPFGLLRHTSEVWVFPLISLQAQEPSEMTPKVPFGCIWNCHLAARTPKDLRCSKHGFVSGLVI